MTDIFVSYASRDRPRIIPLVRALESCGWSVWWDRVIPPGKTFARVIEEAVEGARCVLVVWTASSVDSEWVSNEASEGARRKVLIPALLDAVEIPFEFRRIQAADIVDWGESPEHPGFRELVSAIAALIGEPRQGSLPVAGAESAPPAPEAETPGIASGPAAPRGERPRRKSALWGGRMGIALAMAVVAAAGWFFFPSGENDRPGRREPPAESAQVAEAVRQPPTAAPTPAVDAAEGLSWERGSPPPPPAAEPHEGATAAAGGAPAEPAAEAPLAPPRTPEPAPPPRAAPLAPSAAGAPAAPPDAKIETAVAAPETKRKPVVKPPAAPGVGPAPAAGRRAASPPEPTAAAPRPPPAPTPPEKPREEAAPRTVVNDLGMTFIRIPAPAGPFTMGSPLDAAELVRRFGGAPAAYRAEKPARAVRIERSFFLQTAPVTQGQWRRLMGENPSSFRECGEECPVEMVSWEDARRFVARLNQMEKAAVYRLPTEAEWEYAARAGSESEFFFGDDPARLAEYAWYAANSGNRPRPVAGKRPNAWGLFDMIGNVWQWMEDDWHAGYEGAPENQRAWIDQPRGASRVLRGGAWGVAPRFCRSAARFYGAAEARNGHTGLRLVREVL